MSWSRPSASQENLQYKPTPLSYKAPAPSHVDQVLITTNEGGDFLVKVRQKRLTRHQTSWRSSV